jgi:hypothetical protein
LGGGKMEGGFELSNDVPHAEAFCWLQLDEIRFPVNLPVTAFDSRL